MLGLLARENDWKALATALWAARHNRVKRRSTKRMKEVELNCRKIAVRRGIDELS